MFANKRLSKMASKPDFLKNMNTIAAFLIGGIMLLLGALILLICLLGSASQDFQMGKITRIVGSLIGLFLILLGAAIAVPGLSSVSP